MSQPPDLNVLDDPIRSVGELIAEQAAQGGSIVLTGGASVGDAYEQAAGLQPDWSRATVWWGDERCVPPDDERSNYRLGKETLLDRLAVAPRAVHRMRGELEPSVAADEYQVALAGVELDLLLLGLGSDGHMASLFRGSPQVEVEDRRVTWGPAGLEPFVDRITLTLPAIHSAKRIVFLVAGAGKGRRRCAGLRRRDQPRRDGEPLAARTGPGGGLPRPARSGEAGDHLSSPVPSPSPQDVLEIERPEQLKALGHPLRLKVLQVLGDAGRPLTNRELAAQLSVDPGHLHFHVRMLHRAGLIELAASDGREKPYRPVAKHFKIGPEIRAAGLASEVQAAQLRELQRGFDLYAEAGEFRSAQVHTKLDVETVRRLLNELVERLTELEDESNPQQTITVAFHPTIAQGKTD